MTLRNALEVAALTDAGLVRSFNEDSIATDASLGLFVLADGMGGYKAGDVASGMATTMIVNELRQTLRGLKPGEPGPASGRSAESDVVRKAVMHANQAILKAAEANPQYRGMGTTLALALFCNNRLIMVHSGDSRLYRLRQNQLVQLTQDHSLLREQVELGMISSDDAKISHNRNLITCALGVDAALDPEVREEGVQPGDMYLLCSDGLNDMVDDADIELAMSALQANLPLAAKQLVAMANDNGGHDNVSVVLVKVLKPFPAESRGLFGSLFGWMK
ncbi:MAG: Stp1/IreP family PP2C-type Ser/Thr phosphatase [Pseudomonadota bacterium]